MKNQKRHKRQILLINSNLSKFSGRILTVVAALLSVQISYAQETNPMLPSPPAVEQYMLGRVVAIPQPTVSMSSTTPMAGGEDENPLLPYAERSIIPKLKLDETVTPDTTDLVGERIDLDTGSVSFQQTDISIPGNSGIDIKISRTYRGSYWMHKNTVEFGDWKLDIPHISTTLMTAPGYISGAWGQGLECTGELNPGPFYAGGNLLESHQFWNGDSLEVPGVASDKLLDPTMNLLQGNEGGIYQRVTKSNWRISCFDRFNTQNVKVGEGFRAESPDGKIFTFDQLRLVEAKPTGEKTWGGVIKYHAFMQVSRIEDRFGNWVKYNYDSIGRLETITANDGRLVSLFYDDSSYQYLVSRIVVNNRTWTYGYSGTSYNRGLDTVTLPNSTSWSFNLAPISNRETTSDYSANCPSDNYTQPEYAGSITHPNGMTATFYVKETAHGHSNMLYYPASDNLPKCFGNFSLVRKTLQGDNVSLLTWQYSYSQNNGSYNDGTAPTSDMLLSITPLPNNVNQLDYKTTTVVAPDGSKTRYFYNRDFTSALQGSQMAVQYFDTDSSTLLKTVMINYDPGEVVGVTFMNKTNDLPHRHRLEMRDKTVVMKSSDGDSTYLTEYGDYNIYGVARWLHQESLTGERYIQQQFIDDRTNWRLNLPTFVKVSLTDGNYTTVKETSYQTKSSTNEGVNYTVLLPYEEKMYGTWRTRYASYHPDGNINRIEFNEQLRNSSKDYVAGTYRYQELSNYKRGQAQTIKVPVRYSSTGSLTASRTINDDGQVTGIVDFNGNSYGYGHDSIGRLLYVDMPNDANNWLDTYFDWSQTSGLAPVRTALRCTLNASKTGCAGTVTSTNETKFDSLLRPILVTNTDLLSGKKRYQKKIFNAYNAETFASNWSDRSDVSYGSTKTYDGLQRLIEVSQSGRNSETTEYLSGNKQKFTNSEGYITTTTYLAYGAPAYEQAILIESPEGVTTSLDVNLFGQLTAVTQDGPLVSAQTEYRAYDTNQHLCKVSRSDVGVRVFANNVLGEVLGQAEGVGSSSPYTCVVSAGTDTGKWSNIKADNLGQSWVVDYPDTTPDLTHTRDANGNIQTLTAGSVVHNYTYNSLDLVLTEQLSITGEKTWNLSYGYDRLGARSSMTYPDGYKVSNSPNGYGEPTGAIRSKSGEQNYSYASNATYYPNGTLKTFAYGNGVTHETTLDDQTQMPSRMKDFGASSTLLDYGYGFDDNSNLTSLTDYKNSNYSLSLLKYDGLDRLTETTGGSGIGSSSLTYDGLGNIRSYSSKGRSLGYSYDTENKLTSVSGVAGRYGLIGYDDRGNITANGSRTFTFNRANQLVTSGSNSYLYDGYNRRVKQTETKGVSYSFYNQEGSLVYRETAQGGVNYVYLGKRLIAKDGFIPEPNGQQHYRPFGESLEGSADDVGYTGHKFDAELGLNYMQQRYYDPVIGRFYSNDPVGFTADKPMMFNRYAYANNNPYKFTDPNGRNPFIVHGDSDNATITRESFKEGGDMFVAGMEQAGEMLVDGYLEAGGLVPGIGGLAATAAAGVKELVTDGGVATLTGAVAGEIVGKGVEANIDIDEVADLKGGKVALAVAVAKEGFKQIASKLTESHVENHTKNDVSKDGSTMNEDKNK